MFWPGHASESAGAAVAGTGPATSAPLATLLTRHILADGELILLILKPSMWHILLSSLRFIAVVLILTIAAIIFVERLPSTSPPVYVQTGIFLIAGRIMWAVLQWMGRLYILTDLRIVRISGVFNVDVYDCPLRKVARTRIIATFKERLLRLGSIEIIPQDANSPIGLWQTISRPIEVNEQIVAAMHKAKHTGRNGHAN